MELYLVKMTHPETAETFYKVGVSKKSENRFKYGSKKVVNSDMPFSEQISRLYKGEQYISDHPYTVENLAVVYFKYEAEALLAEQKVIELVKPTKYTPQIWFPGASECFSEERGENDGHIKHVRAFAEQLSKEAKDKEPDELEYSMASYLVKSQKIEHPDNTVAFHLKVLDHIKNNYS